MPLLILIIWLFNKFSCNHQEIGRRGEGGGGRGGRGIPPTILKNLAKTSTSAIEIWRDDMANYTNIVVCHTRRTRLGTPQTSCNVPLHFTLYLNYFLHKIPKKKAHAITITIWNDKPTHNQLFLIAITLTLIETNCF